MRVILLRRAAGRMVEAVGLATAVRHLRCSDTCLSAHEHPFLHGGGGAGEAGRATAGGTDDVVD